MRLAEAENAEGAMGKIEAAAPDLLFTDINLPGMDGIELTKRIRRQYPEMKIVVMTSLGDPEIHAAALADGADASFSKCRLDGEAFTATIDGFTQEIMRQQFPESFGRDHSRNFAVGRGTPNGPTE